MQEKESGRFDLIEEVICFEQNFGLRNVFRHVDKYGNTDFPHSPFKSSGSYTLRTIYFNDL
jgi:hypothetical protein